MLPEFHYSQRLREFLFTKAEGAWEAYSVAADIFGAHNATPVWLVYRNYSNAVQALYEVMKAESAGR